MSNDGAHTDQDAFVTELLMEGVSTDQIASVASLLPPVAPPADLRGRLMAATTTGRLHRFAEQVAALLDVGADTARQLLDQLDDASAWEAGPGEGISLVHVAGGPKVADAITGFVRIARGGQFPEHSHHGEEQVLIVQGRCRDSSDGLVRRPGEVVTANVETTHHIDVLPGPALIYLAVVRDGLRIGELDLYAGDPRI